MGKEERLCTDYRWEGVRTLALSIVVACLVISGMATIASLVCDNICFAEDDDFEIDSEKRK